MLHVRLGGPDKCMAFVPELWSRSVPKFTCRLWATLRRVVEFAAMHANALPDYVNFWGQQEFGR